MHLYRTLQQQIENNKSRDKEISKMYFELWKAYNSKKKQFLSKEN